jgi:hypothetical protein
MLNRCMHMSAASHRVGPNPIATTLPIHGGLQSTSKDSGEHLFFSSQTFIVILEKIASSFQWEEGAPESRRTLHQPINKVDDNASEHQPAGASMAVR